MYEMAYIIQWYDGNVTHVECIEVNNDKLIERIDEILSDGSDVNLVLAVPKTAVPLISYQNMAEQEVEWRNFNA